MGSRAQSYVLNRSRRTRYRYICLGKRALYLIDFEPPFQDMYYYAWIQRVIIDQDNLLLFQARRGTLHPPCGALLQMGDLFGRGPADWIRAARARDGRQDVTVARC